LLETFRRLFDGERYLHRRSTLGDAVARELYEDLYSLGRSGKLTARIDHEESVLNAQNRRVGVAARRGDGSFGEVVPGANTIRDAEHRVALGPIANVEIGVEVKILFKAMIKQIDRVVNDLNKQAEHFKVKGDQAICVGIVGINFAGQCTSYEGERPFPTDGRRYKHPIQEAVQAEGRLLSLAARYYDEFLILKFEAVNEPPYKFLWRDINDTELRYGAILARISQAYERRFHI
jgi:hypothetical protein